MDHTELSFHFKGVVSRALSRSFVYYCQLLVLIHDGTWNITRERQNSSFLSALNKNVSQAFQTLQNWTKMTFEKTRQKVPEPPFVFVVTTLYIGYMNL